MMTMMQVTAMAKTIGKQAKSLQDIEDALELQHIDRDNVLWDQLVATATEAMDKTQAARKRNNAKARVRHAALTSVGMRRTRNGQYE